MSDETNGRGFTRDHITDAKRIVRGEQYLYARALLRARDIERAAPKILTLAGGSPEEEIGLIRELWPRPSAKIMAVDVVPEFVARAVAAGADSVHLGDLRVLAASFPTYKTRASRNKRVVELLEACNSFGDAGCTYEEFAFVAFSGEREGRILRSASGVLGQLHKRRGLLGKTDDRYHLSETGRAFLDSCEKTPVYDLISLDQCGQVTTGSRDLLRGCSRGLTHRGCIMFTFSYGRDVSEAFSALVRGGDLGGATTQATALLMKKGMPDTVAGRLAFLSQGGRLRLRSVMLYRGKESPICSSLWQRWWDDDDTNKAAEASWPQNLRAMPDCSFAKVGDEDFGNVIENVDVARLYACPEERLSAIRRSVSARKAVATRRARRSNGRAARRGATS